MDRLLPIEAGCLCIVTKGERAGAVVTAVEYIGEVDGLPVYSDYWEIDTLMPFTHSDDRPYRSESWLLRVDGGEDLDEVTEEDLLVVLEYMK